MHAQCRTKDGRFIETYFDSAAKTWKGLCRAGRNALIEKSFFGEGVTITDADITNLRVNGNAE